MSFTVSLVVDRVEDWKVVSSTISDWRVTDSLSKARLMIDVLDQEWASRTGEHLGPRSVQHGCIASLVVFKNGCVEVQNTPFASSEAEADLRRALDKLKQWFYRQTARW